MRRIDGISDEEMLSADYQLREYLRELSDIEREREEELSDAVWQLQHGDPEPLSDEEADALSDF